MNLWLKYIVATEQLEVRALEESKMGGFNWLEICPSLTLPHPSLSNQQLHYYHIITTELTIPALTPAPHQTPTTTFFPFYNHSKYYLQRLQL